VIFQLIELSLGSMPPNNVKWQQKHEHKLAQSLVRLNIIISTAEVTVLCMCVFYSRVRNIVCRLQ